jgi:hypothetical protein
MDHCLLQAPRGALRLDTPPKNSHFAGRAGAVMDGSAPQASFDAGQRRIGFEPNPLPFRAPRILLNFRRVFPLFGAARPAHRAVLRAKKAATFVASASRPVAGTDSTSSHERNRAFLPLAGTSTVRIARRYQVSSTNVRRSRAVAPPMNHDFAALGRPGFQACRGLWVCWREKWRHPTRAHPGRKSGSLPARESRWPTGRGAGAVSRTQPSHLRRGSRLCREPLWVLVLRLALSLFPLSRVDRTIAARHVPQDRGTQPSDSDNNRTSNDERCEAPFRPLQLVWAMRGRQSRTRKRQPPATEAGATARRRISSA